MQDEGEAAAVQRRLRILILGWTLIALTAGGTVVVVHLVAGTAAPSPGLFWVLWLATLLSSIAVVYLHHESMRESVSPTEVAAVVVMVLLPPHWAVLLAVTAVPLAQMVTTRGSLPKTAFNSAWQVTGIALGSAFFHAVAGQFSATPVDLITAAGTASIFVLTNTIAFVGLTASLSGDTWRGQIRNQVVSGMPLDLGMGMTGVLAAALIVALPAALPLIAVPTLVDYLRTRARRAEIAAEVAKTRAEAANEAKSQFVAHLSHEMRTPLTAILGFGQLLQLSDLHTADEEAVGHILKAGHHLRSLIDDALDLSLVEAGVLAISHEVVDVNGLVSAAIAMIDPIARDRAISVAADLPPVTVRISTDRRRLQQILLNLLSNAVKYNHDGGDVTVKSIHADDGPVRIEVHDTGPGIPAALRDELFEPFERLGADATDVQGTGLGLALTKQLVQALGGTIGVVPRPGGGSTFWVELPFHPIIEANQRSSQRSA